MKDFFDLSGEMHVRTGDIRIHDGSLNIQGQTLHVENNKFVIDDLSINNNIYAAQLGIGSNIEVSGNILSGGVLGIGATNADIALNIEKNATTAHLQIKPVANNNNAVMIMEGQYTGTSARQQGVTQMRFKNKGGTIGSIDGYKQLGYENRGGMIFNTYDTDTNNAANATLVLDSSHNVGIGTTTWNDAHKLHVEGTLNVSNGIVGTLQTAAQPNITSLGTLTSLITSGTTNLNGSTSINGTGVLTLNNTAADSNEGGELILKDGTNATGSKNWFIDNFYSSSLSSALLRIRHTNWSNSMVFDSANKRIGINKANPSEMLDISGNVRIDDGTSGEGNQGAQLMFGGAYGAAGPNKIQLQSSGYGFGVDDNLFKHLAGSTTHRWYYNASTTTNGDTAMTMINSTLGINLNSPNTSYKLDVNGTSQFRDNVDVNGITFHNDGYSASNPIYYHSLLSVSSPTGWANTGAPAYSTTTGVTLNSEETLTSPEFDLSNCLYYTDGANNNKHTSTRILVKTMIRIDSMNDNEEVITIQLLNTDDTVIDTIWRSDDSQAAAGNIFEPVVCDITPYIKSGRSTFKIEFKATPTGGQDYYSIKQFTICKDDSSPWYKNSVYKQQVLGGLSIGTDDYIGRDLNSQELIVEGNVGIGITNPDYKLDVKGASAGNDLVLLNVANFATGNNTAASIRFTANNSGTTSSNDNARITCKRYASQNYGLVFSTLGDESMYIRNKNSSNSIRVGIGSAVVADPSATLEVDGNLNIGHTYSNNTAKTHSATNNYIGDFLFQNPDTTTGVLRSEIQTKMALGANGTNVLTIDGANERVGINNDSPTTELDVGGNLTLRNPTGGELKMDFIRATGSNNKTDWQLHSNSGLFSFNANTVGGGTILQLGNMTNTGALAVGGAIHTTGPTLQVLGDASINSHLTVHGDLKVNGNINFDGDVIQTNTLIKFTESIDVSNSGTQPALRVNQVGPSDNFAVAEFLHNDVIAMSIRGDSGYGGDVSMNHRLSVAGDASFGNIYVAGNLIAPNLALDSLSIDTITMTPSNATDFSIAIGKDAGLTDQLLNSIAIGTSAGKTNQNEDGIAIGRAAGMHDQSLNSIAIGYYAGRNQQGIRSVAIGNEAGMFTQEKDCVAIGRTAGEHNQSFNSVAIGTQAGQYYQNEQSVALGPGAGASNQGQSAVALGRQPGLTNQGNYSIAIGYEAARLTQAVTSIAIGRQAGRDEQGSRSIAIGYQAGYNQQGIYAIAIGDKAGDISQNDYGIALGFQAGQSDQSSNCIAIGKTAGRNEQGQRSIAIGLQAGQGQQGKYAIAIGDKAGDISQNDYGIALGKDAGYKNQDTNSIAIGTMAGKTDQSYNSVAIGYLAGETNQAYSSIAIGDEAGKNQQGHTSIAMGWQAGMTGQTLNSLAIGLRAGYSNQGKSGTHGDPGQAIAIGFNAGQHNQQRRTIAMGLNAGTHNQGFSSIAIGHEAAMTSQENNCIALGLRAGKTDQSNNCIAVGFDAGHTNQDEYSVAMGYAAGYANQHANTIILNAQGSALNSTSANSVYIKPVRQSDKPALTGLAVTNIQNSAHHLNYDIGSGEVSYSRDIDISLGAINLWDSSLNIWGSDGGPSPNSSSTNTAPIYFKARNGAVNWTMASIAGYRDNSTLGGGLAFNTKLGDGAAATEVTTAMVIDASGRVGIGTDSPSKTLDVDGTAVISKYIDNHTDSTHSVLKLNQQNVTSTPHTHGKPILTLDWAAETASSQSKKWSFGQGGVTEVTSGGASSTLGLGYASSGTYGWAPQFYFTGDGRLGIGTNVPTEKLEVNGNIRINTGANGSGQGGTLLFDDGHSIAGPNKILLHSSGYGFGVDSFTLKYNSAKGHKFYVNSTSSTNGGLALQILDNTDVSMNGAVINGDVSMNSGAYIAGASKMHGGAYITGDIGNMNGTKTPHGVYLGTSTHTGSQYAMMQMVSNNGIGGWIDWTDDGGNSDFEGRIRYSRTDSTNNHKAGFNFYTNSVHRMVIDTTGNVGIGITNPSATLDVNGTMNVSGDVSFGTHLTVNEAYIGNAAYTGYAAFSHKTFKTSTVSYAVLQKNDGKTFINSASGKNIEFRHNNIHKMTLTNGKLGIGTTAPDEMLHILGNIHLNGHNSTREIVFAKRYGTFGILDGSEPIQGGITYDSTTNPQSMKFYSDRYFRFLESDQYAEVFTIDGNNGFVGINDSYPSQALDVIGNIIATGTISSSSDIKLKTNIKPLENALENINKLQGVSYNRIDLEDTEATHIGLIAQELEQVYPEIVSESKTGKRVAYGNMIAPLIEAIKELSVKVDKLATENTELKERVFVLEQK